MTAQCAVFCTLLFFYLRVHGLMQESPLWLVNSNTTVIGRPCPQEKECTCYSRSEAIPGTRADCTNRSLEAVPKHLPNNTSYLDLSYNKIATIGNFPFVRYPKIEVLNLSWNKIDFIRANTFGKLENLIQLDLQYCHISGVEKETFASLPSLTYLDMSDNAKLTFRNLRNISYGLQYTRIKILKLNSIHAPLGPCNTITKNDIEFFNKTRITDMYLDSNRIATLEVTAVDYIPRSIETLSVKHNIFMVDIYMFYMHQHFPLPKLRNLIISDQGRFHVNEFHSWMQFGSSKFTSSESSLRADNEGSSPEINLQELSDARYKRIENNGPTTLDFVLSETITYIDISNSNLQLELGNIALATPNNLTFFLVNKNILWKLDGSFIGFDNLTFLDLSWNYCESISQTALQNMPKLQHLNLSTNFLDYSLEKDIHGKTFQGQSKLENLDLTNNKIRKLPAGVFDSLINLQVLNLSQNILIELHVRLDHMNKLRYLSLQSNMLETIPKPYRDTFDRLLESTNFTLNIEKNRFKCSCNASHQEFLNWMIYTPVYYGNLRHISCFFDNGSTVAFSSRDQISQVYEALKKECSSYILLITVCATLTLMVVFIIISAVCYRYRWNLRYMYYMAKFKLQGYRPLPVDCHRYQYDVFVSYAEEDRAFVRHEIVDKLENDNNMTLLVHERDFTAGEYVCDNILKAITNSRKTLIVLSEDFLKSKWCMYELNMARMEAISRGKSAICVIKKENIPTQKMSLELLDVLQHQTYMDYPQDENLQGTFWERLVMALREE